MQGCIENQPAMFEELKFTREKRKRGSNFEAALFVLGC